MTNETKQDTGAQCPCRKALEEITSCGFTDIDPRIKYLEVQVSRREWRAAREALSTPCLLEAEHDAIVAIANSFRNGEVGLGQILGPVPFVEHLIVGLLELRKDKERLDWLVRHGASVGLEGAWGWYFVQRSPGQNLAQIVSTKGYRAAIDAAMKESQ